MVEQTVTIRAGARGIDFAGWRPTVTQLQSLGVSFVMPYVALGGTWKRPGIAEMQVYLAAGIAVSFLAEQDQGSWTQGYAKGLTHGKSCATVAAAMGYPTTLPITAAWDTYVAPGDPRALGYGNGFADGVEPGGYRLGVYGGLPVIRMMQARSVFNFLAGAAGWSAPMVNGVYNVAAQPDYELVHARQTISGSTPNFDRVIALRPFQAWFPHGVAPAPPIETPPQQQPAETPPTITAIPNNDEEEPVRFIADSQSMGSALVECVIGSDGVPHHMMRGFDVDGARERAVWLAAGLHAVPYSDVDYQALAAAKVTG